MTAVRELWIRRLRVLLYDAVIVAIAYSVALQLRFDWSVPEPYNGPLRWAALVGLAVGVHLIANAVTGVYAIVSRHIGLMPAMRILATVIAASLAVAVVVVALPLERRLIPLSVVIAGGTWTAMGMIGSRFWPRIVREGRMYRAQTGTRTLIVGAGDASSMILREIRRNPSLDMAVVGLVDDNPRLTGMRVNGHPVLGKVGEIPDLVHRYQINEILIAIPSASPEEVARIHRMGREAGVPMKTLPPVTQLVRGEATISDIREVKIEDFLGREKADIDLDQISGYLAGKRVLITGAAGSIGSELTRQVSRFDPESIILVDKDESSLYHLHEQLRKKDILNYFIHPTSVALPRKMDHIFAQHKPDVVFHAAAYKHVPLMEINADEAVMNNVKGTLTIAQLAGKYGVEKMVNISTDKAVSPVNVMGATKLLGEEIVRLMGREYPNTRFASVRFGNVLGSRGSVIPIFQQQIEGGGPVTVTHPDMTRYFMTIEEAVKLVLQAAALIDTDNGDRPAKHGAFVLEMGSPVRILDLAQRMIDLLGNGHKDSIEIRYTGLRPGEKLHEELFAVTETPVPTDHPLVFFADREEDPPAPGTSRFRSGTRSTPLLARVEELLETAEDDAGYAPIIESLQRCVPSYTPYAWTGTDTEGASVWARAETVSRS